MPSEQDSYPEKSTPGQSDTELVLLLQAGQKDVLGILYDRYAQLVYGIALQMLKDIHQAEDLTQDIFLSLANKSSYDPQRGSLRTFLSMVTRSRAIDKLRLDNRTRQRMHRQALNESTTPINSLIEEISQIERSQEVKVALAQLSTQEREVLKMAYYEGLSQSEIATRLNAPLGTVKSRSRRGLIKLRQALAEFMENS